MRGCICDNAVGSGKKNRIEISSINIVVCVCVCICTHTCLTSCPVCIIIYHMYIKHSFCYNNNCTKQLKRSEKCFKHIKQYNVLKS